jgi:glycosyltransferase involved in cell wall biosynthesis
MNGSGAIKHTGMTAFSELEMPNSIHKPRLRLGIIFNFSPQWMGGIIYIINLVKTLNHLDDKDKPEIIVFYSPSLINFLDEFKYPYLTHVNWVFPSVIWGTLRSWVQLKNVFYDDLVNTYSLDALYPANNYPVKSKTKAKVVAWFADLQHKHYPEFFSKSTILFRNARLFLILRNSKDLVVSSYAVKTDFERFYKIRGEIKIHVFHFASVNGDYEEIGFDELSRKYDLPERYFLVSNQFHKHKNHKVVLQALALLKKKGIIINLAITGKLPQAEASPYMAELYDIIEQGDLQDQIRLLGITPREDQIHIMKYSQAVIQPSLFEGWSTVIEDAISLNVPVIASGLSVNIEQLGADGIFFDALDAGKLAEILSSLPDRDHNQSSGIDYEKRIKDSAELLLGIIRN